MKRVAAIDGRRPRGRGVELARHHLVQALEDQLLADRRDAIGGRGGDLRLLDRLVERVGLVPAASSAGWPACSILAASQILPGHRRADARERLDEELRRPSGPWSP